MAVTLAVVLAQPAGAAPGDLDPSFGGDGRIAVPAAGPFVARAVAVDAHDRIVVAGSYCSPYPGDGDGTCLAEGDSSFRVARLTPDGGLDPEFGASGLVTTPVGESRSQALDVVLEPDGTIVAAGVARVGGRDAFALVRYTASGAVDTSFGVGGAALVPAGSAFASAADVANGPGGTLLVAGQAVDAEGRPRMAVARLSAGGVPDPTFGTGGVALGGAGAFGYAQGLTVDGAGGALVAGIAGDSDDPASFRFGELRLTAAGAPDPRFGDGGSAEQRVGESSSFANAVAPLPGGFVAAGAAGAPGGHQAMALYRGRADGRRRGERLYPLLDGSVANDVLRDRTGRILLVGQAADGAGYRFATIGVGAGGSPDLGFGDHGVSLVAFPDYPIARATAAAVQRSGRVVTVGIGCAGGATARCTGGTAVLLAARQLAGPGRPSVRVARRVSRGHLRRGLSVRVRLTRRARLEAWLTGRRRGSGERFTLQHVTALAVRRAFAFRLRPRAGTVAQTRAGRLHLSLRAGPTRLRRTITLRG